jgi:hypothetical protein
MLATRVQWGMLIAASKTGFYALAMRGLGTSTAGGVM